MAACISAALRLVPLLAQLFTHLVSDEFRFAGGPTSPTATVFVLANWLFPTVEISRFINRTSWCGIERISRVKRLGATRIG